VDLSGSDGQVPHGLFDGIEACVLGDDENRAQFTKLLTAGGATLMTSKNTLEDGVRLFSCDITNSRYRRYAALNAAERPDIMHSRLRRVHPVEFFPRSLPLAATFQSALQQRPYCSPGQSFSC
jgi:hypothetical protein